MIDREKVIERLDKVSLFFKSMLQVGYDGDADIYREHRETVKMAIELLKKQEYRDKMFHALEEDWKRLKTQLKEQEAEKKCCKDCEYYGNCHDT